MSFEQFKKQDFFSTRNHIDKYSHVPSELISGSYRYSKISVVIPTYKRSHLLEEAIKSCMEQSYTDFDIVISDNNPDRNDETENLIRHIDSPRIVYYKNKENIGPLANFNRCIELSNCDFCVFLCSDDLLAPDYIQKIVGWLDGRDDIDMLLPQKDIQYPKMTYKMRGYSTFLRTLACLTGKETYMKIEPKDFILYYPAAGPSGIVYKRSSFFDIGGFNPQWHPTGDYIMHFLMALKKNTFLISTNSGKYRMQENISQEKGIRGVYIIQNYLIRKVFSRAYPGNDWSEPFYKGAVYKWLKLDMSGNSAEMYDVQEIMKYIKTCTFMHFVFYIMVWCLNFLLLPFRSKVRKIK